MKTLAAITLASLALASPLPAIVEPGLPAWNEGERAGLEKSGWIAGGALLTDQPVPEQAEPAKPEPINVSKPTAEEIAENNTPTTEIPEKFWPEYFGEHPKTFLVDPQGLLSPVDSRDRLGFLNYHAGDSTIDMYVYLFKGDQEIPGEVREEELVERFFSTGRPAVVVLYFMGAPQRSVLYLSPSLTDAVPVAERYRALESSMMQALKDANPSGQLQSFLVQMSIRIYWMERMMGGGAAEAGVDVEPSLPSETPVAKPSLMVKLQPILEKARAYTAPASAVGGMLLLGMGILFWTRRRTNHRFPEFDVEPRLGGPHAAGVGAVISFASAALPPASQRDQVPDYLRRA